MVDFYHFIHHGVLVFEGSPLVRTITQQKHQQLHMLRSLLLDLLPSSLDSKAKLLAMLMNTDWRRACRSGRWWVDSCSSTNAKFHSVDWNTKILIVQKVIWYMMKPTGISHILIFNYWQFMFSSASLLDVIKLRWMTYYAKMPVITKTSTYMFIRNDPKLNQQEISEWKYPMIPFTQPWPVPILQAQTSGHLDHIST